MSALSPSVRAIAFYLPQFHPIPENDAWWGKGFTEWTKVVPTRRVFPWQHQPHVPADLGFYDLRVPETRAAQAELARQYGVHGFCYYHYWFHGRRMLERPFHEVLASGEPDFPFCLCWANQDWSRSWYGRDRDVLLKQTYSAADDAAHIRWLCRAFEDARYIRVNGRPVFLIYRAQHLPEPRRTVDLWRDITRKAGVGEVYLCSVQSTRGVDSHPDPRSLGFDAAVEFHPDHRSAPPPLVRRWGMLGTVLRPLSRRIDSYFRHCVYEYREYAEAMLARPRPDYMRFPGIIPSWDNTARHPTNAIIVKGATPSLYERWLTRIVESQVATGDHNLLFINAWNEWAEGCHLEPCRLWGHQYLEATARVLRKPSGADTEAETGSLSGSNAPLGHRETVAP